MKIRNKSDSSRVIAAAVVAAGETVDVPQELAESLCQQTDRWELVAADSGEEE